MTKVQVLDTTGKKVSDLELNANVFGITPNEAVLFEAINMQRASLRQGTQSAKTRSEVSGGGRKPWRQKGTGRARQGSIRSPQWKGGGVVFAPKPRSYGWKMPKKQRQLALKSALSLKVQNGDLIIVDNFAMNAPKTKEMKTILTTLGVNRKGFLITNEIQDVVQLSARNIPGVIYADAKGINVLDIMNSNKLVLTVDAVKAIEEVLA